MGLSSIQKFELKDVVVVGAGVAGATTAWFLKRKGLNVSLVDKARVATGGGSSAAGAFISPKIGKGSLLQRVTNLSFDFSWRFYKRYFGKSFCQSGVLRIPKDEKDRERFQLYLPHNYPNYQVWNREKLQQVGLNEESSVSFFFPDAGYCDAKDTLESLVDGLEFLQMEILSLKYQNGTWHLIGGEERTIRAKRVVLALGYENSSLNINMEYMGIKGLWGSRGDYKMDGGFEFSLHKDFSISSVRDGIAKIGATHIKSLNPCLLCNGQPLKSIEDKALKIIGDVNENVKLKLLQMYCAMRAVSRDHFPIVGDVVDIYKTYQANPNIVKGAKFEPIYHKNLYLLNGLGGRGFVFAPYLSNILSDYILYNREIPKAFHPDRLFLRWIRREGRDFFRKG